jgi:hypothetical protein
VWHRVVESLGTVAVTDEWSIVLALYCSCLSACFAGIDYAACLHVLQAMSGALETCARALEICVPSRTGRTVMLFFMLEARGPQGAMGYVAALEPTSTWR